jgi:hypothetical protein
VPRTGLSRTARSRKVSQLRKSWNILLAALAVLFFQYFLPGIGEAVREIVHEKLVTLCRGS